MVKKKTTGISGRVGTSPAPRVRAHGSQTVSHKLVAISSPEIAGKQFVPSLSPAHRGKTLPDLTEVPLADAATPRAGVAALGFEGSAGATGGAGFRTADIIGRDDRTTVQSRSKYPFRAICQLKVTKRNSNLVGLGTGWLVGTNLIITAGHVICHNKSLGSGFVDSVVIDGVEWGAAVTPIHLNVTQGWANSQSMADDYGVIVLQEPIGNTVGSFSLNAWSDQELGNMLVNVVGFPMEASGIMKKGTGAIEGVKSQEIRYFVDTTPGQSGCPVIFVPDENGPDDPVFGVGVHNYGRGSFNSATRINESVIRTIQGWM